MTSGHDQASQTGGFCLAAADCTNCSRELAATVSSFEAESPGLAGSQSTHRNSGIPKASVVRRLNVV